MTLHGNFWKILFLFLILLLIFVSFFGVRIYVDTKHQIESLVTDRYRENLGKIIREMEASFRRVEVDLMQMADSSSVLNFKLMKNRGENVNELMKLQDSLIQMKMTHPEGDIFYYYNRQEQIIISDIHGSFPFDEYYDREWYDMYSALNSPNKLTRLPVRELQGTIYYTIVYSGKDFILVANLNTEKIYNQIKSENVSSQERILVSDENGSLVHSYNPYGRSMEQNPVIKDLLTKLTDGTGVFQDTIFEERDFIVIQKSDYNDWFYMISSPLKWIDFQWINFRSVILLNLIPLGIIGIFLSSLLVILIYGPYNQLADSLRKSYKDYGHGEKNAFDCIRNILNSDISRIVELEEMVNLYRITTGQKLMIDFLDEAISKNQFINEAMNHGFSYNAPGYRLILLEEKIPDGLDLNLVFQHVLPIHGDILIIEMIQQPGKESRNTSLELCSGVISPELDSLSQLPSTYEKLVNSLEYVKFYSLEGLFDISEFDHVKKTDLQYPEIREKQLLNKMEQGDSQGASQIIDEILKQIVSEGCVDLGTIHHIVTRILFAMLKLLPFKKAMEFDVLKDALFKKNLLEIRLTLYSMCIDICSYLENLKLQDEEGNIYSKKAKDYIDEHFQKDISLDDIAGHLKISYPYLSRMFKEGADENILYYINKKRIDKSKELLQETDKTIEEIAREIGYNNTQSFSRYFKKREGITPGKYKSLKSEIE